MACYIPRWYTRPKTVTHPGTNRAGRALTSFMRRTPLTTTPRRQLTAPRLQLTWESEHRLGTIGSFLAGNSNLKPNQLYFRQWTTGAMVQCSSATGTPKIDCTMDSSSLSGRHRLGRDATNTTLQLYRHASIGTWLVCKYEVIHQAGSR